jgi:hypothetical protein
VTGALDAIEIRLGFASLLARIAGNAVRGRNGQVSLRDVAKELAAHRSPPAPHGYVTPSGKQYSAAAIASMLAS